MQKVHASLTHFAADIPVRINWIANSMINSTNTPVFCATDISDISLARKAFVNTEHAINKANHMYVQTKLNIASDLDKITVFNLYGLNVDFT